MKIPGALPLSFLFVFLCACGSDRSSDQNGKQQTSIFSSEKIDTDDFAEALKLALENLPADSSRFGITGRLVSFYKTVEYHPLWIGEDGNATLAQQLLNDLDSTRWDGFNTERYHLNDLKKQLNAFIDAKDPELSAAIHLDTSLTHNYLKASRELLIGLISPRSADSLWFHTNDSLWRTDKAIALLKTGTYFSLDSFRSRIRAYGLLSKALRHYDHLLSDTVLLLQKRSVADTVKGDSVVAAIIKEETPWLRPISDTLSGVTAMIQAYQQYFGLKRTGKKDSATLSYLAKQPSQAIATIKANMERLRWLPQDMEPLYVLVNIPAMELVLNRDRAVAMKMNVVVGKISRQTPVLNADMANVVINPPWGVPPTILKKDVLPGFAKSGNAYLRKKGLKVYDYKGNLVDASTVNTSNYKRYVFRQAPGERNALGNIKFNLPNKWDIYLHDTPHREDFTKYDRAQSSGCVRIQQPKEMAEYILAELEGRRYTRERIDSVINTRVTRWEVLKNKIPVHIVYLTAWEDGDGMNMRFARDVYKKDAKLMAALGE